MTRRHWLLVAAFAFCLGVLPAKGQEEAEPPPPPQTPKVETLLPPSLDELLGDEKAEAAPVKKEKKKEATAPKAVPNNPGPSARIAVMPG